MTTLGRVWAVLRRPSLIDTILTIATTIAAGGIFVLALAVWWWALERR